MIGRAGAAIKECGAVELACLISLAVYMDSFYCCSGRLQGVGMQRTETKLQFKNDNSQVHSISL